MSFHTLVIVGHLGREPELRYAQSGQAVTNFNLAANRTYTDAGGLVIKETTWFRVSAWGKTAENIAEFLHKGSLVLVEGRLVCDPETGGPRVYTRQDGTASAAFEVNAATVRFLSSRTEAEETDPAPAEQTGGEIPF